MPEFSDFLENKILDHVFRNTAYTPAASIHLALYTTTCSDSARGTEVSGNNYSRQPTAFSAAAAGAIGNSAVEAFTATGGSFGTVVCTGLEDALTVGNQLCFDNDFASTAVNDGDTLQFGVGAVTVTLS